MTEKMAHRNMHGYNPPAISPERNLVMKTKTKSTGKGIRSLYKRHLGDHAAAGRRVQDEYETLAHQRDQREDSETYKEEESRNQFFTFSNVSSSESRDTEIVPETSENLTKSTVSRQLMIQKGRKLLERNRGINSKVSEAKADATNFDYQTSQDEASYVDDLLMSIFEEDSLVSERGSHRWEDVQERLLTIFESTDSDERNLREIIIGLSPRSAASTDLSMGSSRNERPRVKQGKLFSPTNTVSTIIEEEEHQQDKAKAISQNYTLTPPSKVKMTPERMPRQAPPLLKRRGGEESNQPGGTNPVKRNTRSPLSPSLKPSPQVRPKHVSKFNDKNQVQERLKYLKEWLKDREVKSVSPMPFVPLASKEHVIRKSTTTNEFQEKREKNSISNDRKSAPSVLISKPMRKESSHERKGESLNSSANNNKTAAPASTQKPAQQESQNGKRESTKNENQQWEETRIQGNSSYHDTALSPRNLRIQRLRQNEISLYQYSGNDTGLESQSPVPEPFDAGVHVTTTTEVVWEAKDDQQSLSKQSSALTTSFSIAMEGEAPCPQRPTTNPLEFQVVATTPRLRKSSRAFINPDGDNSVDLSVSYKDGNSFESKDTAKIPTILLWRMDPLESLSDFIIQIQNEKKKETITYHVHKHILGAGPRKSKRLDAIFQSKMEASAHFVLDNKVASFFPLVLDFIYAQDYDLQLTTDNAVIFRHLAKLFQISSLMVKVTAFIEQDMQVSNLSSYVTEISTYKDHSLRKLVQATCAKNIEQIDVMDPLWIIMDPDLFSGTLSCPLIDREKTSPYLSILVKEYTSLHMHEMDEKSFGNLTSPNILPAIDRQAALPLLEICFSYGSPKSFEPLQERCACTMASYWKITNENDKQRLFALLRNLPSSFTVDFLQRIESGKAIPSVNASRVSSKFQKDETETTDSKISKSFSLGCIYDNFGDQDEDYVQGWRLAPGLSYSDWTIRVKHTNSNKIDTYHVHKHVLALGQYRSVFFSNIFLPKNERHSSKQTTTVELNYEAAEVFPQMLDFIYSPDRSIEITTETCVAIRFLARTFKVWMLNKEVLDFIQEDMSLANIIRYVEDSDSFLDEVVAEIAIHFCATNILAIDVDSLLLQSFKPGFFGRVVSSYDLDPSTKAHVSILTAKYFVLHGLEENLLEDILKEADLETIDCLNALKLLQIICTLKSKDSEFFTKLRGHCTDVLKENWNELRETFRNELFTIFQTLDSVTVADLFEKVEKDYHETVIQPMEEQSKLLKNYESQLKDKKYGHKAEVDKVKKEMQDKVDEIAAQKAQLEKKLKGKDKSDAKLAKKNIPLIVGAVSSLSEDSNMKLVAQNKGCGFFSSCNEV